MADVVQRSVSYVGGPNGGTSSLVVEGGKDVDGKERKLETKVQLPGGHYELDRGAVGENSPEDVSTGLGELVYRWVADPERRDRTPRDGDEASRLLADHDGATPVLEQEVTSSTTVASGEPVPQPEPQAKVATGSAEKRAKAAQGTNAPAEDAKAGDQVDESTSPRTVTKGK